MDTTTKYILMCEKAEEIQEIAPLESGTWYAYLRHENKERWILDEDAPIVELIVASRDEHEPGHVFEDSIEHCWLPTQDQLQEMIKESFDNLYQMSYRFYAWQVRQDLNILLEQTSMEQLWLAFVMKEKYNKTWNREEWADACTRRDHG